MQSLRSRKPSENRPTSLNRASRMVYRDVRKSTRVDDKIRKRMSTRYADVPYPTDASIPAVPALPSNIRQLSSQDGTHDDEKLKEESKTSDLKLLDVGDFDPEGFLKAKMANSTEAELKTLQFSLQTLKDGVQKDLQRNVFKNYAEFVNVSKEVSTLENEMLEFKDSLAEWKGMPSLLHIDESTSAAERRRNVRSSIADLKVLYANQMQNLHTHIEGSAKFVPTTPGRHVIAEVDGIMALNPATYRVDHSCRFVLLDDAVLVARRRRRMNNAESEKLIAERCWPLNEMLVLDTKDTSSMSNVFKIRHNKETHVYRTEAASDKKNLLSQFRHIAEELAARRQKEREGEHQRRKTLYVNANSDRNSMAYTGTGDVPPMPDFLADLMDKSDLGLGSPAKAKAEQDARWIGDFSDDLTVAIALRKWEDAVNLVQEGENKLPIMPALSAKLSPLKSQLTSALLQALSLPTNRKSVVVQFITLLLRLGAGPAARNAFLTSRSEVIRKSIRTITFEGSVSMYVADLAIVVFTGVKHTAEWFLASFKENDVASSFVEWAKTHIENFAEMFRKQVYSPDVDPQTVEEAISVTQVQSKKLLEDFGLDFRFLLEQLLMEKPKEPARLPPYKPHVDVQPPPITTPSPTPVRARSPALTLSTPTPSRRPSGSPSPAPPLPPIVSPKPVTPLPQSFVIEPGTIAYTPTPAPVQTPPLIIQKSPQVKRPLPLRPGTPESNSSVPRPTKSPAPPPRSRDRPGSAMGHRPLPNAIPKREGMF